MPDLLAGLRAATSQAHADLEQQVDIPGACRNLNHYVDILSGFLGFFEPMESRLSRQAGWPALNLDLEERSKIHWLKQDLLSLGLTSEQISALPRCSEIPPLENFGQALGAAYVLEGSTLGGRQIMQILSGNDRIPSEARRFFASYGEAVGEKWKAFCAALNQSEEPPAEVIRGANDTFATLAQWLTARKISV